MSKQRWTSKTNEDYLFSVNYDFVYQLEQRKDHLKWDSKTLAQKIGIGKSWMSQILNNRGNMTLSLMIRCARALGLQVSVVAYDNHDEPVPSDIFRLCWEKCGRPSDAWAVAKPIPSITSIMRAVAVVGNTETDNWKYEQHHLQLTEEQTNAGVYPTNIQFAGAGGTASTSC